MIERSRTTCITPAQIAAVAPSTLADLLQAARRGVLAGMAVLALVLAPGGQVVGAGGERRPAAAWPGLSAARAAPGPDRASAPAPVRTAEFGQASASPEVRAIADWIARSADNSGLAFVIVDKRLAQLHIFDVRARWRASSAVLLGAARGDDSVAGIGQRPLSEVRLEERTTPAGRFVADRGRNSLGDMVVWVDYEAAVSMHRVRTSTASERRLERLASPAIDDHRISWGCINVPVDFFDTWVAPMFVGHRAVVYVLPEVKSLSQVFTTFDLPGVGPRAPGALVPLPAMGTTPP